MSKRSFVVELLPRVQQYASNDAHDTTLIKRYRQFRLNGLQSDPEAFASSYLIERQHGDGFWAQRLHNPKARHMVAVACGKESSSFRTPIETDWLGMVVLIGPKSEASTTVSAKVSPWTSMDDKAFGNAQNGQANQDGLFGKVLEYHLAGAFVVPSYRRHGVGSALFLAALDQADSESRSVGAVEMKCTVLVDMENLTAKNMYEKAGFTEVGMERYTPAPTETGPREERNALLMEHRRQLCGVAKRHLGVDESL